jgi:hypothetical protein
MVVVHAGEAAQAGVLVRVTLVDVPDRVRLGDLAALVHHLVGGRAQALDPRVGQQLLEQDVAVLEIRLALLLREDLRLDRENLFGRHGFSPQRGRVFVRRPAM